MIKRFLPFGLLLLFFALALTSAAGDSPTMDEQNHIARGLAYLRTGDPRLSVEHPPLVNSLSALPLLLQAVELPTGDWSWKAGEWYRFADQLLWQVNHDAERMVFVARLPIMFLGLLLGACLYRFSRTHFGPAAALLALVLYVFDPNIMAHTRYATTDMGATVFIFLAAAALWRADKAGYEAGPVALAGAAFGLALSAKLSAVVFGGIFGLLFLFRLGQRWWRGKRDWFTVIRVGILYPLSALMIVWVIFGFDWGPVSDGGLALPMPVFWRGIGAIFDFSGGGRPAFLLGHFSAEGFWYYFPLAFLVKTPLPTLCMIVASVALFLFQLVQPRGQRVAGGAPSRSLFAFLLVPAVLYFAISTQSALNLGYRHLLPILPFLFVFTAGQLAKTLRPVLIVLLLGWLAAANTLIFPHYLSYFNELVGPADGYHVLVDSNVDWGQDLKRLKEWMAAEEIEKVKLAWFGSAYPSYYGLEYDPLPGLPHHFDLWDNLPFDPAAPEPGVYAISVSMLQELHRRDEDKHIFAWFRAQEPDDRIGYSILVYQVKPQ